jgi:hypothetical protein
LNRGRKLLLHGDGKHTRRYLYAGDAADAFDTILHKGTLGQIYNIPSSDEISNTELCSHLMALFGIPNKTAEDFYNCVQHTRDRPFNDRRYAVDGAKLKALGWRQKTTFADGLKLTVEWYRQYGERWWGNIENLFQAFPEVSEGVVSPIRRSERSERCSIDASAVAHTNAASNLLKALAEESTPIDEDGKLLNGGAVGPLNLSKHAVLQPPAEL